MWAGCYRFAQWLSGQSERCGLDIADSVAQSANMDGLDRSLLALLRRDARASLSDLAAQVRVSRATVRARIDRMVASGEITAFTVETPADLAQSPVRGLTMLAIEGPGTERIKRALSGRPEVRAVHATNGKWDIIVELGTSTLEELDRLLTDIRKIDGVASSETNLLLSTMGPAVRRTV